MVIVDTNILIDHLRRVKQEESHFERIVKSFPKETLAVSMITVQELYGGKSTKAREQEVLVVALLTRLKILPYTYDLAQLAGKIARDLPQSIEFADAAIAATAIINGCSLATLNKKDFQEIQNLKLLE